MDLLWGIFHISHHNQRSLLGTTLAMSHGNTWYSKMQVHVQRCVCVDCASSNSEQKPTYVDFELTSTGNLDSVLTHCQLTTKNICFHVSQANTQLWLAGDSLGLASLPEPTYWGGQVAGQMPSSSAPQWKISTFLTGQMSNTWQDHHPDSPMSPDRQPLR